MTSLPATSTRSRPLSPLVRRAVMEITAVAAPRVGGGWCCVRLLARAYVPVGGVCVEHWSDIPICLRHRPHSDDPDFRLALPRSAKDWPGTSDLGVERRGLSCR